MKTYQNDKHDHKLKDHKDFKIIWYLNNYLSFFARILAILVRNSFKSIRCSNT